MHEERDQKHDQENEEQNPGHSGCREGDKSESQHPRYQRDNQEDQSIKQHGFLLSRVATIFESLKSPFGVQTY
jgi:hypothetical protein